MYTMGKEAKTKGVVMMNDEERNQQHEKDLERLESFCLMDDDFLSAFFRDNIEDTEFILRIIRNKPMLRVTSVHAQHELKNLNGRSVRLDVHAVDEDGTEEDIEIQRDDRGAGFKRVRHNSSMLDCSILKTGEDPEFLPETYVIFITEKDVIGKDKPIYPIDRYIVVDGEYIPFGDGSHILYVNGAKKGSGTALEKLIHDFHCKKADDMYYSQLAKRMRYFKESQEGVETMCRVMEEMRDEVRAEAEMQTKIKNALEMIADHVPLDKVAKYSHLPIEKVRELASGKSA